MRRLLKSLLAHATCVLGALMVALVLVSWLLSAMTRGGHVRSLLTSEGIRWFFSAFVDRLASPVLVWLVLVAFAVSAVRGSGLLRCRPSDYRQRVALWLVAVELALFVGLLALLALVPHAILLSVTGHLVPGPFSRSLVPYACFAVCAMSVSYAWMSGKCHGVAGAFDLLTEGVDMLAPLLLFYVFAAQLACAVSFVFRLP